MKFEFRNEWHLEGEAEGLQTEEPEEEQIRRRESLKKNELRMRGNETRSKALLNSHLGMNWKERISKVRKKEETIVEGSSDFSIIVISSGLNFMIF